MNLKEDGEECTVIMHDLNKFLDHIRTHTKEKPYVCRYKGCNEAYSQLGNMTRHMNSHKNIKRFECDMCNKKFTTKQNLYNHKMKINNKFHKNLH